MSNLINPPNKKGKSPDYSLTLPLKKKLSIVGSGGKTLIQDTALKRGFENGLLLVYSQKALDCPCDSIELQILNFKYSSTYTAPQSGNNCNNTISKMVLTWTFNKPIKSAAFTSCFSEIISVPVSDYEAVYTIQTNRPGSNVDSQPLYYELIIDREYLFTGYFIIPRCT